MIELLCMLFFVSLLLGGIVASVLILASIKWHEEKNDKLVQVVVLGDVGRSPRMQYHCLSLVELNYTVDVLGYGGKIFS